MCERTDSIVAQYAATEQLLAACSCGDHRTFRAILNDTTRAPLPPDFNSLLGDIDEATKRTNGGAQRHARRD
jgi:hypothetical protein